MMRDLNSRWIIIKVFKTFGLSHSPNHLFSNYFIIVNMSLHSICTNRQHDRQAASAAVQEPTRTRRGSAWRSCQIPRERYSLAMPCPIKYPQTKYFSRCLHLGGRRPCFSDELRLRSACPLGCWLQNPPERTEGTNRKVKKMLRMRRKAGQWATRGPKAGAQLTKMNFQKLQRL